MEQELWLPTLSHFANDNGWSGSSGLMCYEIERPVEEQLTVVVWYGPFSRMYAEEIARERFPVTEEGVAAMAGYLKRTAAEMNAHPARSPEDTMAWYQKGPGGS